MKKYRAGIDIGSTTVKLVVLDDADEILYGDTDGIRPTRRKPYPLCWKKPRNLLGNVNCRFALPAPVRSIWGKRWIFPLSRRSLPSLQP